MDVGNEIISVQKCGGENVTDVKGWTQLHWAASRGHFAVVDSMLDWKDARSAV